MGTIRHTHTIAKTLRSAGCGLLLQLAAAGAYNAKLAAAELQEVTDFGGEPGGARMFVYVPDQLAATPAVLVAIHYCTGSAQAYFNGTSFRGQADKHGFIVIYPETTASDRCFDVHSEATLKHDGGGDSGAIAAMVRYTLREHNANARRVYVAGTSSGAMMTNVMVGAYPELFRAGAAFAGVPFGCFAGPDRWNGDCAMGRITKTGQEWGELVRDAYPGYSGPRPRMQLWHGDQDETLSFHNFTEAIKQWTNVLAVSEMATSTEQNAPQAGWNRTRYADANGVVRVEAMVGPGMPHNLSVLSDEAIRFFGLDMDMDTDIAGDPSDAASSGGAAGSSGATGSGAAGTAAGAAGAGAAGQSGAAAGVGAAGTSSTTGSATTQAGAGGTTSLPKNAAASSRTSAAGSEASGSPTAGGAASTTNATSSAASTTNTNTPNSQAASAPPTAASGCNASPHSTQNVPYTWLTLAAFWLQLRRPKRRPPRSARLRSDASSNRVPAQ